MHHRHPAGEPWSIVPFSPTTHTLEEELPQTPLRFTVAPLETLDQTRAIGAVESPPITRTFISSSMINAIVGRCKLR